MFHVKHSINIFQISIKNSQNQLPVGSQGGLLVQFGKGAADHLHFRRQATDLELVEPLIANVEGDILDDEHDDGLGLGSHPPGLDHATGQTAQGLILGHLGDWMG